MDKVTFGSLFVKVATQDKRARVLAAITGLRKQAAEQRKAYVKDQIYGIITNTMQKQAAGPSVADVAGVADDMGRIAAAKKLTGLALQKGLPAALANAGVNKGKATIKAINAGKRPYAPKSLTKIPQLGGGVLGFGARTLLSNPGGTTSVPAAGAGPQNIPPSK